MNFKKIILNKNNHDKIAKIYEQKHPEIYNIVEQTRLKKIVKEIVDFYRKSSSIKRPKVLDLGAGTGNLSKKFLKLNCKVTAVDVSHKMLEQLQKKLKNGKYLETRIIKGK